MGAEYNHIGEVCEPSKHAKGEEIHMGNYNNFEHSVLGHEQQVESLELEHPWRENYRAPGEFLEGIWSWILKKVIRPMNS
jgi:hypothetical protein